MIILVTLLGLTVAQWNLIRSGSGSLYNTEPNAMPLGRRNPSTWVDGNNLYIFGGRADTRRLNDLWKYETASNRWFWQPDTPLDPRSGSSHWFLNGVLWIYGGRNDTSVNHALGDLWSYDLTNRKWTRHNHLTNPGIRYGSYSWTHNSQLYLFGGKSDSNTILDDAWRFDTRSLEWQLVNFTGATLPPRDDGVAVKIGNSLYFFDGNKFFTVDTQTLIVAEITSRSTSNPVKREDYVMWSNGSTIYLFGGRLNAEIYNDFWQFDTQSSIWTMLTDNKPSGRWGSGFSRSQTGELYLFGGALSDSTSLANDVWMFGPNRMSVTPPSCSNNDSLYPTTIAILILTILITIMVPSGYFLLWRSSKRTTIESKPSGTSNDFATV